MSVSLNLGTKDKAALWDSKLKFWVNLAEALFRFTVPFKVDEIDPLYHMLKDKYDELVQYQPMPVDMSDARIRQLAPTFRNHVVKREGPETLFMLYMTTRSWTRPDWPQLALANERDLGWVFMDYASELYIRPELADTEFEIEPVQRVDDFLNGAHADPRRYSAYSFKHRLERFDWEIARDAQVDEKRLNMIVLSHALGLVRKNQMFSRYEAIGHYMWCELIGSRWVDVGTLVGRIMRLARKRFSIARHRAEALTDLKGLFDADPPFDQLARFPEGFWAYDSEPAWVKAVLHVRSQLCYKGEDEDYGDAAKGFQYGVLGLLRLARSRDNVLDRAMFERLVGARWTWATGDLLLAPMVTSDDDDVSLVFNAITNAPDLFS